MTKNLDRDSDVKVFLQPGLGAQKVEKHCSKQSHFGSCIDQLESFYRSIRKDNHINGEKVELDLTLNIVLDIELFFCSHVLTRVRVRVNKRVAIRSG